MFLRSFVPITDNSSCGQVWNGSLPGDFILSRIILLFWATYIYSLCLTSSMKLGPEIKNTNNVFFYLDFRTVKYNHIAKVQAYKSFFTSSCTQRFLMKVVKPDFLQRIREAFCQEVRCLESFDWIGRINCIVCIKRSHCWFVS